MNKADQFVEDLYCSFNGRVPIKVGFTQGFEAVYPLVFENSNGVPIGLIGCASNKWISADLVQIYHLSTFKPNCGAGTIMMKYLCTKADLFQVSLCLQAEQLTSTTIDRQSLIQVHPTKAYLASCRA